MKPNFLILATTVASLLSASAAHGDNPKATLEFRLAVAEAADGFTRH